jgi:hypothetical protein
MMTKPKAIICDIDGCIDPINDKKKYIKDGNWKAWHDDADKEEPNIWCVEILKGMQLLGYELIFVSARPGEFTEQTTNWIINKSGLRDFEIHLNDNHILDFAFKLKCYKEIIEPRYDVLFVIDDRQRVVDMWRKQAGLICLQPNFEEN